MNNTTVKIEAEFNLLKDHLGDLISTVSVLSGKKQDEIMNKLKVKAINKVLTRAMKLMENEPSTAFIEVLDEETLPTNSDALLLMNQFLVALTKFRSSHSKSWM